MSKYIDGINEEAMDEFLAALRSGEWKQGNGQLENKDGEFCCLGVACKLFHTEVGIERVLPSHTSMIWYGNASGSLPPEIANYLGIPQINRTAGGEFGEVNTDVKFFKQGHKDGIDGAWVGPEDSHTAITWNDVMCKSFAEIADAFEQEFTKEV